MLDTENLPGIKKIDLLDGMMFLFLNREYKRLLRQDKCSKIRDLILILHTHLFYKEQLTLIMEFLNNSIADGSHITRHGDLMKDITVLSRD